MFPALPVYITGTGESKGEFFRYGPFPEVRRNLKGAQAKSVGERVRRARNPTRSVFLFARLRTDRR